MRIVDVADFFSERGGGVRSYLGELCAGGSRRGHEIVVVAPGPRDSDGGFNGGRLVRLAGPPMPYDPSYHLLWRVDRVRAILDEVRPDVVQASSPYLPALLVRSARAPLRSFVYHSDQISTYVRPVLEWIGRPRITETVLRYVHAWPRHLSRGYDVTVAPSEAIAESLKAAACERVHCVRFGVRSDLFSPQRANDALRREILGPLAERDGAMLGIVACRLAVEKRVDQILDAVRIVNERRPMALLVLGDGPERARLERRARSLPVSFRGFLPRDEYSELLASADVFVHGGAAETFGFVLGEAVLSGLPLVVPGAGAAADFADIGVAQVYAPYGGPRAIAAAIQAALDVPAAERRASAERARSRVRTTSEHFDELFALYESELEKRRVNPAEDVRAGSRRGGATARRAAR